MQFITTDDSRVNSGPGRVQQATEPWIEYQSGFVTNSALILISYGQSNIILIINKYINYIAVIHEFICDISSRGA